MGATVLHDEAVFPVREAGIPIHIKNTNRSRGLPAHASSRSGNRAAPPLSASPDAKALRHLFTEKAMMNQERGYGAQSPGDFRIARYLLRAFAHQHRHAFRHLDR